MNISADKVGAAIAYNSGNISINNNPDPKEIKVKSLTVIPTALTEVVGRKTEITDIQALLSGETNALCIRGMGGVGKTTLAKIVLTRFEPDVAHLAWIDAANGLVKGFTSPELISNLRISDTPLTEIHIEENRSSLFKIVISTLSNMKGEAFLVIDNLLDHESKANLKAVESLTKNWSVLITSRHHVEGIKEYDLDFLPLEDCRIVFYEHYKLDTDHENLDLLLEKVGRHTLTTELIAKTGQKMKLKISELKKRLESKGLSLKTNITSQHSNETIDNIQDYILKTFALGDMSKTEEFILKNLSVLDIYNLTLGAMPTLFYFSQELTDDVRDEFNLSATNLYEKGWLAEKKEQGEPNHGGTDPVYQMHQIIKDVVKVKLKPSLADCQKFVAMLTRLSLTNIEKDLMEQVIPHKLSLSQNLNGVEREIFDLRLSMAKDFKDFGSNAAALEMVESARQLILQREQDGIQSDYTWYMALSQSYVRQHKPDAAKEFAEKAISLAREEKMDKKSKAQVLFDVAQILFDVALVSEAKPYAIESLEIREEIFPDGDISIADNYDMLGDIDSVVEKIINEGTVEKYIKAFRIREKFEDPESVRMAMAYLKISNIMATPEFREPTLVYLSKSVEIYRSKASDDIETLFLVEFAAAMMSVRTMDYETADFYFTSAIKRREESKTTVGISFSQALVNYAFFCMEKLNDPTRAKEAIKKACEYGKAFIDYEEYAFLREARDQFDNMH